MARNHEWRIHFELGNEELRVMVSGEASEDYVPLRIDTGYSAHNIVAMEKIEGEWECIAGGPPVAIAEELEAELGDNAEGGWDDLLAELKDICDEVTRGREAEELLDHSTHAGREADTGYGR